MANVGAPRPVPTLNAFSDPASVAVVGASDNAAKWGYWLGSGALRGQHRRSVYFVNPHATAVLGNPSAPSLSDLPEVPELVALCVPARTVPAIVAEGLDLGVRGFLCIAAGIADEPQLAATIRSRGARLVGANSLGIYDAETQLQLVWGHLTPGPLAVVSQSGQLGSELAAIGARHGVGISRFVSIGNQSDVAAPELLADLAEHDSTRVVAVYLESFTDGETLFDTLAMLREAGKPTVLLTVGASAASARLARSHTGSLTSPMDIVDAACRASGVLRVDTPTQVINVARTLLTTSLPAGRRVAIVGDSGGQSAIAADLATANGLSVPQLSDSLTGTLAAALPSGAGCSNPVDLAGAGENDLDTYASVIEQLLAPDEVDAVVLTGYFGCYGSDAPARADQEADVARRLGTAAVRAGKPVLVHTMGPDTPVAEALWDNGVPVFGAIESALGALADIARLNERVDTAMAYVDAGPTDPTPGYWSARALLTSIGVDFPNARLVRNRADLDDAAAALTPPLVLKAGWLDHKSDVGGVAVGIADHRRLLGAFADMHGRLGDGDYVVEEQDVRDDVVEMLVGARRDPDLGPVIVVGAGGTETEVHQDVALERAPVSDTTAAAMIARLRCAPLLNGWRGRAPVDLGGLAVLVSGVSQLIAARPDIDEIELNPVRVDSEAALPVDALVVVTDTNPKHSTTSASNPRR
jgi:acetate---CoA ligase (ADP-forming)